MSVLAVLAALATAAFVSPAEAGLCPAAPRPLCRSAGVSKIALSRGSDPSKAALTWNWTRGSATGLAEFGSPASSTVVSVCVWDAGGLVFGADLPAGAGCGDSACWSPQGSAGLQYRDPAAANGGITSLRLRSSAKARTKINLTARSPVLAAVPAPLATPITVQLLRDDSPICFESLFAPSEFSRNDASAATARNKFDVAAAVPALASDACGQPSGPYAPGLSTDDQILYDGVTRTFRVYLPPSYDADTPTPVVLLFHGGFGTAAQVEASSRLLEVADQQGFIVVSADGIASPGGIRTWNAGGCCGFAVTTNVDDVGFVRAMIDHVQNAACVDRRRVYAAGMSNGAMFADRLACDLADRIRAIASVSGSDMTASCAPARPMPVLHIHGSDDSNVPFYGGFGCGPAGVPYTSIPRTISARAERNGCSAATLPALVDGDATCTTKSRCSLGSDVELCVVEGGGHQWPGGLPPAGAGFPSCPFGYQSQNFSASEHLWDFFASHPSR